MRRFVVCLALLVGGLVGGLVGLTATPSYAADRDCGDFATQAAAQSFFLDAGGPRNDPHNLDADSDGVVCESNPCPCSTSQGGGGGQGSADLPRVLRQPARVERVVDGDTVVVRLDRSRRLADIRLVGIDTPELSTGCAGEAAKRIAERMLPRGTRVVLVSDSTQDLADRYGRLLRYVMKGNTDINKRLVKRGYAAVYVYDNTPFQRTRAYRAAAAHARSHQAGLWAGC
jgi:endonuclease YncB( thermonuclease family)